MLVWLIVLWMIFLRFLRILAVAPADLDGLCSQVSMFTGREHGWKGHVHGAWTRVVCTEHKVVTRHRGGRESNSQSLSCKLNHSTTEPHGRFCGSCLAQLSPCTKYEKRNSSTWRGRITPRLGLRCRAYFPLPTGPWIIPSKNSSPAGELGDEAPRSWTIGWLTQLSSPTQLSARHVIDLCYKIISTF